MNARTLVYRFGFRLACLVVTLIALSIAAMTYFFATREPEAVKEVSGWFKTVVMALVALLGGLAYRTLRWLSDRQQASAEDRGDRPSTRLNSSTRSQSRRCSPTATSSRRSGSSGKARRPRGRRDPSKK